jgi:hypothetical protein
MHWYWQGFIQTWGSIQKLWVCCAVTALQWYRCLQKGRESDSLDGDLLWY